MSLETILPFLQPIAHLITDPGISEVMLNPDGSVFIERAGRLERVNETVAQTNVEHAIKRIAHRADRDITEAEPLLEVRLPDGSRVSAICPPLTTGWCFTLRKFREQRYSLSDLVSMETITSGQRATLESAARDRRTILVSGGTSTGKTSMLNAIASVLPKEDRIVLIEDIAEICIDTPNVVQMQARPARDGIRAVTIRDLVKQSLRFRPDRLIVGEVRGAEAFDLLQALNSGHAGSMSTIHATTAESALNKLALYAMQAALDIPLRALGPSIAEAIHIVVQMNRRNGRRIVDQILRVEKYSRKADEYLLKDLTHGD
jgi:pilus assembly protein CpaF